MPIGKTAIQDDDGSWTVRDVPIFGELPKGERSNKKDIGREWMEQAIAKAALREKENYLPPLHINHHDWNSTTRFAGHFRLTRVEEVVYEGEKILALFADFVKVPQDAFALMEAGALPYRSAEVHDWDAPELNSLALLATEVPFFRFEILRIGQKIPKASEITAARFSGRAALGTLSYAKGGAALFRFSDSQKDTKPMDPAITKLAAALEAMPAGKIDRLMALLQDLIEKISGAEEPKPKPVEPGDGAKKEKCEDGSCDDDTDDGKGQKHFAALEGKIAALETKDRQRDERDAIRLRTEAALKKLDGYHVPPDVRTKIDLFAAKGQDVVDAFVDSYMATVPKDPPQTYHEALQSQKADAPEVAKFADRGPEALKAARAASALFDRQPKGCLIPGMTREKFIEIQLRAQGLGEAA